MRLSLRSAHGLTLAVVAFVTDCAGNGGPAAPVLPAGYESSAGAGLFAPGTKPGRGVLYVGSLLGSHVAIYDQRGSHQQMGDITQGLSEPWGMFVDRQLNLYVTNFTGASVSVYPPGGTSPSRTLTGVPVPASVVVARDGTAYVATYTRNDHVPYGPSAVVEYPPGATTPSRTVVAFHNRYTTLAGVALDSADDLFVAFNRPCIGCRDHQGNSVGEVLEIKAGSSQPKNLGIRVDAASALTIDKAGNILLLVRDIFKDHHDVIDVYAPGSKRASQRIDLGFNGISPTAIALDGRNKHVWVVKPGGSASSVFEVAYPAGTMGDSIAAMPYAIGIATSPEGSE